MRPRTTSTLAALTLSLALFGAGCKSNPPAPAGVKNADGSITNPDGSVTYPAGVKPPTVTKNADGSITNADGSTTYPAGTSPAMAASSQPATPAPAPMPPPPARVPEPTPAPVATAPKPKPVVSRVAPAGSRVSVRITETIAASKNNVGDTFTGELAEPLVTAKGTTVFPKGARVSGEVVAAKGRGRFKGAGDLGIQLTSIDGVRVQTSEYEKAQSGKGKRTGALIGGGGGLGALIGGLAGGGKGALIGGLAGAGAGTAGAAYTGNKDVVIPSESVVAFRLTSSVSR